MKVRILSFLLFSSLGSLMQQQLCAEQSEEGEQSAFASVIAEAEAKIVEVQKNESTGDYWVTIEYEVPESQAKDLEGNPLERVTQHFLSFSELNVGDRLPIRYMIDEPIVFHKRDEVQV